MCLDREWKINTENALVYKKREKTPKEKKGSFIAWKVFKNNSNFGITNIYFNLNKTLKLNIRYTSEKPGFHCYVTREGARNFAKNKPSHNPVVYKVKVSNVYVHGYQSGTPALTARYMTILERA